MMISKPPRRGSGILDNSSLSTQVKLTKDKRQAQRFGSTEFWRPRGKNS
jgi:hypothetical protein